MRTLLRSVTRISILASGLAQLAPAVGAPLAQLLPENSFESFTSERIKVSAFLGCTKPRLNQASGDRGSLYSCIGGKAATVQMFVNEKPNSRGAVSNVKFLWNDYTKNVGDGVHADAAIAKKWAGHLADMYAPDQKKQVLKVFLGKKAAVVHSATHLLTYTYTKGPAVDERMIVVTKK